MAETMFPVKVYPTGVSAEPLTRFRIVTFPDTEGQRWQIEREVAPNVWIPEEPHQLTESDAYRFLDWLVNRFQRRTVVAVRSARYG